MSFSLRSHNSIYSCSILGKLLIIASIQPVWPVNKQFLKTTVFSGYAIVAKNSFGAF